MLDTKHGEAGTATHGSQQGQQVLDSPGSPGPTELLLYPVRRAQRQSGGAPALRPGAVAQSPGREAALAWASLAQRAIHLSQCQGLFPRSCSDSLRRADSGTQAHG